MMQEIETRQPGQTESFDSFKPVDCGKKEGKYLAFTLDKEDYGIRILKVREIIGMMPITNVPQTPDFVLGVINLRGKVIPVVDLRVRFGMRSMSATTAPASWLWNSPRAPVQFPWGLSWIQYPKSFTSRKATLNPRPLSASKSTPILFWVWPRWATASKFFWTSTGF
jgi:purine-binding chemotaxis protein CheW